MKQKTKYHQGREHKKTEVQNMLRLAEDSNSNSNYGCYGQNKTKGNKSLYQLLSEDDKTTDNKEKQGHPIAPLFSENKICIPFSNEEEHNEETN